jgi:hypothetical protein
MTKRGAGWVALGVAVACIVLLAIAAIVDRRATPPAEATEDGSDYSQQMAALDVAYKQGTMARKKMLSNKVAPTNGRCVAMFRATAASELGSSEFEAQAEEFFISGCRARKKPQ